jgi:purine-binding chemotaxis protein CheW
MTTLLREQYIEIVLGKDHYAVNTKDVHKIIKMQPLLDAPESNAYIEGAVFLRGKDIPLISLSQLFGLSDHTYTQATRIIIHKNQSGVIGFIVDQVNKTSSYEEINPIPHKTGGGNGAYLQGMTVRDGIKISILEMDEIIEKAYIR